MKMARMVSAPADVDAALIREIASGGAGHRDAISGRGVRIGPELLGEVQLRCELARAELRRGQLVYGVNTGMGALSGVRLTQSQQLAHQRNLMLARATGGPPWLDAADVRAVIAVRLRTFLSGDAGVSGQLCQRLADFLNAGIIPAVPRTGAGCAGEIIPLAHAFGPLAGIGQVLGPGSELRTASQALRDHGIEEFVLGPKEGIALLAGVPGATALSVRRVAEARAVAAMMEAAAALSIAAAGAPRDPYTAACARGDDILAGVLRRLRTAIGDNPAPGMLQAPVSFRVAGTVLTQVQRAADALTAAIERALAGVTDSPAFLDGRFVGTAGFHGIDLAAHCDQVTAALAHAAEVSAARIHRLLDPLVTGLPAQLAAIPGPDAGLVAVHKRAAGEVHAMRRLASATPVGLIETSGGQEDVQSFGWEAAETLRAALHHARVVTACELLTASQAVALAGRPPPPGCRPVLGWLAGVVEPIRADRPFGADIQRIAAAPWPEMPPGAAGHGDGLDARQDDGLDDGLGAGQDDGQGARQDDGQGAGQDDGQGARQNNGRRDDGQGPATGNNGG
jgi:histidine ammonia-lyase